MIALERQTEIIGVGSTALYRHRSEEADRQTPNGGLAFGRRRRLSRSVGGGESSSGCVSKTGDPARVWIEAHDVWHVDDLVKQMAASKLSLL